MSLKHWLIVVFVLCAAGVFSQNIDAPKREFRAAWIATVANIDWPSNPRIGSDAQKEEFITLIDNLKEMGINTLIVQVRPASDAFYKSDYEPWSQWLTGYQGIEPTPYYDPLNFMVEEAHKRNLEFHAWINPFRAVVNHEKTKVADNHISKTSPHLCFTYGKNIYIDPGMPEARGYVIDVVTDIVERYDIDGVHIDDYFYPYTIKDVEMPDTVSFNLHKGTFTDSTKGDWRRNNINLFIEQLYDSIHFTKPYVKFGISPFGVWKNKSQDADGSETRAFSCYEGLYADSRKWSEEGWIDYMAPQIYWHREFAPAKYGVLAEWWNENHFDRHLYIGIGAYRVDPNSKDEKWKSPSEMPSQIRMNRRLENVGGEIYFSAKSLVRNNLGIADSLKTDLYKYPALVPVMPWLDEKAPPPVEKLELNKSWFNYNISWKEPFIVLPKAVDTAAYYVVYRFKGTEAGDINNPANIYKTVRNENIDINRKLALFKKKYTFVVTAVDRMHNESIPSKTITVKMKK